MKTMQKERDFLSSLSKIPFKDELFLNKRINNFDELLKESGKKLTSKQLELAKKDFKRYIWNWGEMSKLQFNIMINNILKDKEISSSSNIAESTEKKRLRLIQELEMTYERIDDLLKEVRLSRYNKASKLLDGLILYNLNTVSKDLKSMSREVFGEQ